MSHISTPHLRDFQLRHDVSPADGRASLWGFGEVMILFASNDGTQWWTQLQQLVEPSGVPLSTLVEVFNGELEAGSEYVEVLPIEGRAGVRDLLLVGARFVEGIFEHLSPWSEVLRGNLEAGEPGAGPAGALRLLAPPD